MPETWYVHQNDLIGGWSVLNRDHPPSGLNRRVDPDGREVATFMSEADARRIADLHNAEALYACETCPDDGWGCCGSWNDGMDRRAFVAGRRRERERLAAAGRLLPEGGQTRTEWGTTGKVSELVIPATDEASALRLAGRFRGSHVVRRTVVDGPWVAVDPEEKTDA